MLIHVRHHKCQQLKKNFWHWAVPIFNSLEDKTWQDHITASKCKKGMHDHACLEPMEPKMTGFFWKFDDAWTPRMNLLFKKNRATWWVVPVRDAHRYKKNSMMSIPLAAIKINRVPRRENSKHDGPTATIMAPLIPAGPTHHCMSLRSSKWHSLGRFMLLADVWLGPVSSRGTRMRECLHFFGVLTVLTRHHQLWRHLGIGLSHCTITARSLFQSRASCAAVCWWSCWISTSLTSEFV